MSIIKWTPFLEPFAEMERWFDGLGTPLSKGFIPAVDVYETNDKVVIETPLPGIDPAKVNISVENDILIIKGEAEKESEVEDKNYYRKEIRSGSFYRSILLPTHVIADKAEATAQDGILKLLFPKRRRKS